MMQGSENSELQFRNRLKTLIEVTNQLSRSDSLDDLCRHAVELARSRLKYDRVGLWFLTEDQNEVMGSFGTDEQGQVCDERDRRMPVIRTLKDVLRRKDYHAVIKTERRHLGDGQGRVIGTGTHIRTTLWDGEEVIGFLCVDNLLTQTPITDDDCEILALLGASLGHLCMCQKARDELKWELRVTKLFAQMAGVAIEEGASPEDLAKAFLTCVKSLTRSTDGFVSFVSPLDRINRSFNRRSAINSQSDLSDRLVVGFPEDADESYVELRERAANAHDAFFTNALDKDETSAGASTRSSFRNLLIVPVIAGQQHVGHIALANSATGYSERIIKATRHLAGLFAVALERANAEQSVRGSEMRLRQAHHIARMADYALDLETGVFNWSMNVEVNLAISTVDVPRSREALVELANPLDRDRVVDFFQPEGDEEANRSIEFRILVQDGIERWLRMEACILRDERGQPASIFGIVQDITLHKRTEAERARLADQLRQIQKLDALGQMSARISHEFKNYLAAIDANVDLILKTASDEGRVHGALKGTRNAIQQAKSLLTALEKFGRQMPTEKRTECLCNVVEQATPLLRHTIPRRIKLETDLCDNRPCRVHVNSAQLHQVLLNLTLNACDAMNEGGTLRVAASLTDMPPEKAESAESAEAPIPSNRPAVELLVSDTGQGMPPDIQSRIFEPFFTTRERTGGTGLGLSIIHGIVKEHGGRIDVASNEGAGTTVRVVLPLVRCGYVDDNGRPHAPEQQGERRLVLLAVGNVYCRGAITMLLKSLGYDTIQAEDAGRVIGLLERHRENACAILCDGQLAARRSHDRLRQIRDRFPKIPILVLNAIAGEIHETLRGDVVLLPRSFDMDELARILRDALGKDG